MKPRVQQPGRTWILEQTAYYHFGLQFNPRLYIPRAWVQSTAIKQRERETHNECYATTLLKLICRVRARRVLLCHLTQSGEKFPLPATSITHLALCAQLHHGLCFTHVCALGKSSLATPRFIRLSRIRNAIKIAFSIALWKFQPAVRAYAAVRVFILKVRTYYKMMQIFQLAFAL